MNEGKIKIESGIEIPNGGVAKWSFLKDMKIGQSFVTVIKLRTSVISSATNYKIKVLTRTINDTEIRVWRVK